MMQLHICFIGFGHMARAMAQGWSKQPTIKLSATAPSLPMLINDKGISTHPDNSTFLGIADIVILAVKPPVIKQVLAEIKPKLAASTLVVSIAAGITQQQLHQLCHPTQVVIRCMPNLPVAYGQGMVALQAGAAISSAHQNTLQTLFEALGHVVWVADDKAMHAFTALCGSGPAYVYYFIESLTNAGIKLGLSTQTAKLGATQTLKGALELLQNQATDVTTLRQKVTSPGGTTAAGINKLVDEHFETTIYHALKAAFLRAKELEILP
ncbi:MAG TPA: pyrroline-5-carboxylate reductase [Legionellales bacterium]|nr:pyrroline-5-carboxylate reductase [Legionellales bacterium]|tara:strand:+ start:1974 stop:2774 length:801 start_codon:yes stop_codon:yes gene_type:complete